MLDNPSEAPQDLPPHLRYLKTLVTVLAATMILGLITVIGLLVIRLGPQSANPLAKLPAEIALPAGAKPSAVSYMSDRILVLTAQNQALLYSLEGELLGQATLK